MLEMSASESPREKFRGKSLLTSAPYIFEIILFIKTNLDKFQYTRISYKHDTRPQKSTTSLRIKQKNVRKTMELTGLKIYKLPNTTSIIYQMNTFKRERIFRW